MTVTEPPLIAGADLDEVKIFEKLCNKAISNGLRIRGLTLPLSQELVYFFALCSAARKADALKQIKKIQNERERRLALTYLTNKSFDFANIPYCSSKDQISEGLGSIWFECESARWTLPRVENMLMAGALEDGNELRQKVFLNVTNVRLHGKNTGIQSVAKEVALAWLAKAAEYNVIPIFFDVNSASFRECYLTVDSRGLMFSGFGSKVSFRTGNCFVDIDASWQAPYDFTHLCRLLVLRGVRITVLHHDLSPLLFPELSHSIIVVNFLSHLACALLYSENIVCVSPASELKLRASLFEMRIAPHARIASTMLGSAKTIGNEVRLASRSHGVAAASAKTARRLVAIGTIEPRKNYAQLIRCWPLIRALGVSFTLIGMRGGGDQSETLCNQLGEIDRSDEDFRWLSSCNDENLVDELIHSDLLVSFSLFEGYGMPVAEALSLGIPVLHPDEQAMNCASGGCATVYAVNNDSELMRALQGLALYHTCYDNAVCRASQFAKVSWADTCADLESIVMRS